MNTKWIVAGIGCAFLMLAAGIVAAVVIFTAVRRPSGLAGQNTTGNTPVVAAPAGSTQASFQSSCVATCQQNHGAPQTCMNYCTCQFTELTRGQTPEQIDTMFREGEAGGGVGLALQARIEANVGTCGSTVHDEQFMYGCLETCVQQGASNDVCNAYCGCALAQLRAGMDAPNGTMWMMRNIDVQPPTPEGQARMQAAMATCRTTVLGAGASSTGGK